MQMMEKMMANLLDRLADNKYRQKVEQVYLKFFTVDSLDGLFLANFLFKSNSYLNKKLATSFKHSIPRLNILLYLISNFDKYEQ